MINIDKLFYFELGTSESNRYIKELFMQSDARELSTPDYKYGNASAGPVDLIVAGCSYTYGSGLAYSESWGIQLANKLNTSYVNISCTGWSMSNIVHSIFNHIRSYGNPKYIAILATELNRGVEAVNWVDNYTNFANESYRDNKLNGVFTISTNGRINNRDIEYKYARKPYSVDNITSADSLILRSILSLSSLIMYCKAAGISLVWGTWNEPASNFFNHIKNNKNLEFIDLTGYIDLPIYRPGWSNPVSTNGIVCDDPGHAGLLDYGDDDAAHSGSHYHRHWADMFYEAISKS